MRITSLFLLILFLSGCASSSRNDQKQVFTYNESNGISSLDPAFSRNLENMWAVNQLFDGLVELDSNLQVEPLIAESWDILDSGRKYVFRLRDDVYWHKSEYFGKDSTRKVIAQDFVYSFNRILDPSTASPGKWVFDAIAPNGVQARDEFILQIELEEAFPPFLSMLAMQYCNVVPREIVEHYGEDFRSNPIGCGPFKMAFWMENVALVYHKNESFWQKDGHGQDLPYLDAIKIEFVRDMSAEFTGLIKGQYDFMSGIHPAYKDELLTPTGGLNQGFDGNIEFQKTPFIKTDYIGILVDSDLALSANHPLSKSLVRRALNHAINRDQMVRYLRNNSVISADEGFIPKGLPGHRDNASYRYDYSIAKAKKLLSEAGHEDGEGLGKITLSTTSDYVDLCEFLQFEWRKIGINCEIEVLAGASHREKVSKSQAQLFRKSWLADYPDADNFLGLFYSENYCPGGPNYTHFYSQEFDSLFLLSRKQKDLEKRTALYEEMDSLIMMEAPVIPLFYDQVSHFIRPEVTQFETNAINMLDLKETKKR